jgi:hypothetical protein
VAFQLPKESGAVFRLSWSFSMRAAFGDVAKRIRLKLFVKDFEISKQSHYTFSMALFLLCRVFP